MSFAEVGRKLKWQGKGVNEQGICAETGDVLVSVDPRYFRPAEVELLVGDASKAKRVLDWEPTYTLEALCSEMVKSDIALFKRDKLLKDGGHEVFNQYE
jgi:GDPmannose 4,6-dehydratase